MIKFIDDMLTDVAKKLPDNTPYEAIKEIVKYCIEKSNELSNLSIEEKQNLIHLIK